MQVDLLIIGQGLCGSWLSYECQRAGLRVCVIDTIHPNTPSRISAGIINPITGRRHAEVWLSDELLSHAQAAYVSMGEWLNRSLIRQSTLIDFFPSEQMRTSFIERLKQQGKYVAPVYYSDIPDLPFEIPHGAGLIDPAYLIDLPSLLEGTRNKLLETGSLLDEKFESSLLQIESEKLWYKNIEAERVIFCDGNSQLADRFFPNLPFAPNKGEVLILEIPELPSDRIYKHGVMLAPLSNGYWWCGSSYQWSFDHPYPTPSFREQTEQTLKKWLKLPYRVIDHIAGIRPATLERRPFVGFSSSEKRIGILNGMGTKGCSLAPYFARQLVRHWMHKEPIHPEASVGRFEAKA